MIPDLSIPIYNLGPIPVDPWGTLVCIGFVLGLEIARARGLRLGLEVRDIVDATVSIVLSGFVVGHLVHVLAYHPEQWEKDGIMSLLRIWAGFSSFGGFLGAVIGAAVFFRWARPLPFWRHGDVVMYAFPFAWIFGRLGCFLAKDHIGRETTFFLGQAMTFQFEGRQIVEIRHNLGLYEALWSMVIAAAFLLVDRRPRFDGFYIALFCILYAPMRFGFDFLRNTDLATADVRWVGLTPAQWGCLVMFGVGVALFARPPVPPPDPERLPAPDPLPPATPQPGRADRRSWFRIQAPTGSQAILRSPDGSVRFAPIIDVSAGGVAIHIGADETPPEGFKAGAWLDGMELRLIGEPPITCVGVVRNLRMMNEEERALIGDTEIGALLCGIELMAVPAPVRTALIHYVMRQERSAIQTRRPARVQGGEVEAIHAFIEEQERILRLQIRDISVGGLAFYADPRRGWIAQELIGPLHIQLPGQPVISVSGRIIRVEEGVQWLYAVAFDGLSPAHTAILEAWIHQRQLMQRQPRER